MSPSIPEICDYDCPHADFPPAATAGICRTMSAVWCRKLDELVNKNLPCEWRKRGGDGSTGEKRAPARKRGKTATNPRSAATARPKRKTKRTTAKQPKRQGGRR